MRAGWKTMKLDEACFVDYGTRVVRKKDGGTIYPVYGGGGATFRMNTYNRENCLVVARFAMSQTCTRFVQGKFFLNDSGLTLRAKDKDLSQVFLDWIITSKNDLIYSFGKGSAQKNLDMEDFRNMEISFPISLAEQQRIVDILDQEFAKIDALKANAEKSLQAAKDLFQATLKKELEPKEGWEMKRITEIASLKAGKFVSAQDIFDERGEGLYPCFGGNGLRGYVKTYNHEGRFNIIGRQGALCGNINIADGKFHATEHAVVVSPIVPVIFKFLYYSLCNANINQYATGAAQPGISVKNINERLFLAIPSLAEQKKVANQLDQIKQQTDTLQDNYQKTLSLCDDLKQSLLRKAFNGEL